MFSRIIKKSLFAGIALSILSSSFAGPVMQIPNTPENLRMLDKLGLDYSCMGSSPEHLHFHYDDHAEQAIASLGKGKKAIFGAVNETMADAHSQFEALGDDLGIYHTFEELEEELQQATLMYPKLAKLTIVGRTFEDRPIYALEVSNSESQEEKVNYLVTGTHHAREWISTEVPLASIADLLQNFGKDEEATSILNNSKIVFVPMLNVDGAIHSRTQSKMWRKNRNKGGWGTGVDNNRNYAHKWGGKGSSGSGWSQTYRGPEAMSEIENQVIRSLQEEYGFTAAISFHSYSELILWPWGYTNKFQSKDHETFSTHGKKMGELMGGYRPIQASGLYPAAGIFDDYLYNDFGVVAYTIELGRQFVPPESEVPEINENGSKMLRYVFTNIRESLGQQDNRAYQAKAAVEELAHAVLSGKRNSTKDLQSFSIHSFNESEIQEAMDGLKMEKDLRGQLFKVLKQVRSFSN